MDGTWIQSRRTRTPTTGGGGRTGSRGKSGTLTKPTDTRFEPSLGGRGRKPFYVPTYVCDTCLCLFISSQSLFSSWPTARPYPSLSLVALSFFFLTPDAGLAGLDMASLVPDDTGPSRGRGASSCRAVGRDHDELLASQGKGGAAETVRLVGSSIPDVSASGVFLFLMLASLARLWRDVLLGFAVLQRSCNHGLSSPPRSPRLAQVGGRLGCT